MLPIKMVCDVTIVVTVVPVIGESPPSRVINNAGLTLR